MKLPLASLGIVLGLGLAVSGCTDTTQSTPRKGSITANRRIQTGSNVPRAANASSLSDTAGDTNDVAGAGGMGNAVGMSAAATAGTTR